MAALLDPLLLIIFLGGLVLAFVIARSVRRLIDRRQARNTVAGPDTRSRQVRRAQRRQTQKRLKR